MEYVHRNMGWLLTVVIVSYVTAWILMKTTEHPTPEQHYLNFLVVLFIFIQVMNKVLATEEQLEKLEARVKKLENFKRFGA